VERLLEEYSPPTQEMAQRQKLDSAADYIAGVFGRGAAREQMKQRAPLAPPPPTKDDQESTKDEPEPAMDAGRWTMDAEPGSELEESEDALPLGRAPLPPPAPVAPASSTSAAVAPGGALAPAEELPGVGHPSMGKSVTAESAATYIPSPAQEEGVQAVAGTSPSSWERVNLGEGVELHYPAQADARTRGNVARLIEAARRILGKDPGNGE
jgi:hypothetical protein